MTMKTLMKKSAKDLQKELLKAKSELLDLRFKAAGTKIKDLKKIRALKLKVAHILTALNSKK